MGPTRVFLSGLAALALCAAPAAAFNELQIQRKDERPAAPAPETESERHLSEIPNARELSQVSVRPSPLGGFDTAASWGAGPTMDGTGFIAGKGLWDGAVEAGSGVEQIDIFPQSKGVMLRLSKDADSSIPALTRLRDRMRKGLPSYELTYVEKNGVSIVSPLLRMAKGPAAEGKVPEGLAARIPDLGNAEFGVRQAAYKDISMAVRGAVLKANPDDTVVKGIKQVFADARKANPDPEINRSLTNIFSNHVEAIMRVTPDYYPKQDPFAGR